MFGWNAILTLRWIYYLFNFEIVHYCLCYVQSFREKTWYLTIATKMSSPAKEMPKIAADLKGELLQERSLKPTEAQEKNVLPTADDVKQEKTHQNIMTGNNIITSHLLIDRVSVQVL